MISNFQKFSPAVRYGLGALFAVVALGLQWMIIPWVGARIPFLLFIPTLALTAALFGRGPASLVLVAGAIHGLALLAPAGKLTIDSTSDRIALFVYFAVSVLFMFLGGQVRLIGQRAAEAEQAVFAERLKAQNLAQANDHRFQVALDSSEIAFNIVSPVRNAEGRIIDFKWSYLNAAAAAILGQRAEDLIGRHVSAALPGNWYAPDRFDRYVAVSSSGKADRFELRSDMHGVETWFHVIAWPLEDSVVIWFADVTERKRQEQALHDADRRKDEFLATLAHELRNPLAPIRQAAFLSKLPTVTEAQRHWSSDVIERQVQNMALLLDDLLDVSRITRGQLLLRKSITDVNTVVEAAIETAQPLIDAKKHQFSVTLPRQRVYFEGDQLRLAQVVANLLTNAAKYTDPGGRIRLTVTCTEEAGLTIVVTDNGIGIPAGMLTEIFQMFTQVKSGGERSHGGLGIGLALAKGLVELHGGRIDAQSDGSGQGSEFTVRLPIDAVKIVATEQETTAGATAPVPMQRVLIADDNRDAADTLAAIVGMAGHQVLVAYDGEVALSAFESFRPHIALLDIGMPKLNGIEVAQRVRDSVADGDPVLVAVTGWGQSSDRKKTFEAGFDFHLTKPVEAGQLMGLLASGRSAANHGQNHEQARRPAAMIKEVTQ